MCDVPSDSNVAAVYVNIALQRVQQPLYPTDGEVVRCCRVPTRQVDVDNGATGVDVHGDPAGPAHPDLVGDPAKPGSGHHDKGMQKRHKGP